MLTVTEIFSSHVACSNILHVAIFQMYDAANKYHKNDMMLTKTAGIGAMIAYNYEYYDGIILSGTIYIFLICIIYFNFKLNHYVIQLKMSTKQK